MIKVLRRGVNEILKDVEVETSYYGEPIKLKSRSEIEVLREANLIVAAVLKEIEKVVRPGVTTHELNALAERISYKKGAVPAFKNYDGYPSSLCVSINDEVIHGIPSKERLLKEGDIVSIDFGVYYRGWFGDAAITIPVGEVDEGARRLIETAEQSLYKAIETARPGRRLYDISWAIQDFVESRGYSVVKDYVGHGIGENLHEPPQVPNFGTPNRGIRLREGMVLAIEPMVNAGCSEVKVREDGWTAVTADGKLSAHFEHSIAITSDEPIILSQP